MQGFDFQKLLQPQHGPFAAQPGLFYAPKRTQLGRDRTFINSDHAALNGLRDAEHAREILGIKVGCQPVRRIVSAHTPSSSHLEPQQGANGPKGPSSARPPPSWDVT